MPSQLAHPGVYIEEVPSGTRPITGVATSIAAFVGRTSRGPFDEPLLLHSWAAFDREFGGVWLGSPLGHAVRDFYLNGGRDAVILRLYVPPDPTDGDPPPDGVARFALAENVALAASSPGTWGNTLHVGLDRTDITGGEDRFNLTIQEATPGGRSERIIDLSLADDNLRFALTRSSSGNRR